MDNNNHKRKYFKYHAKQYIVDWSIAHCVLLLAQIIVDPVNNVNTSI